MDIVLLIARLLLAAVFGVAGIAKLFDRAGSREAVVGFGVPKGVAALIGSVLPILELMIAAGLAPSLTAWWAALTAGGLLVVFLMAIVVSLARGQAPDCHCFGRLHPEPVGWRTFFRNLALAAVAGFIVVAGQDRLASDAVDRFSELHAGGLAGTAFGILTVALLVVVFILLSDVLKKQEEMLGEIRTIKAVLAEEFGVLPVDQGETIEAGLPVGAKAPGFELPLSDGSALSLEGLLGQGRALVLIFVSPDCGGCQALMPAVRRWQSESADRFSVVVVSKGEAGEAVNGVAGDRLLIDTEAVVAQRFQARWKPAAVLIEQNGSIGSRLVYGEGAIREFFGSLLRGA